jgi:diguanylate cyclase (GGDEF)-like protein
VGVKQPDVLWALRGLLDVAARALDDDLPGALQGVVDRLAEALDVEAVVINLLRPAWDDFEPTAIHAPPHVHAALRGGTIPRSTVETLLDPRFDVGGACFVPAGAVADDLGGVSATIHRPDRPDSPDHWHEDDELLVPIRGDDGSLLGFVSLDEPASGLRPGPQEIEVAVAVTEAAASAVRTAQRAIEARRNRDALALLFGLSSRLIEAQDVDQVLRDCCEGIRAALGFERVAIELLDPETRLLRLHASAGWDEGVPAGTTTLDDVERLCDPAYEVEGCYLLPQEVARQLVGSRPQRYDSERNGVGPLAWDHHWLIVPLRDGEGTLVGWVWPDDPADCLLPSAESLRVLRTFANQALAAVVDAANVAKLRDLARLDDLTGVLNRRAFFERLSEELDRSDRYDDAIALVICDLDRFKDINDQLGHPAGDDALRRFTDVLSTSVRSSDVVGRIGGDEFAMILVDTDEDGVKRILARVKATLEEHPLEDAGVRASFGTARSPDDGTTRAELVAIADQRLYDDKRR